MNPELESKISDLIHSLGFILYDVFFVKENENDILRILITHAGSPITLEDCQKVSEVLSPMLDVELSSQDSYFLEVSSKGLERILKIPRHFSLSIGEKISLKLEDKSVVIGILRKFDDDILTLEIEDGEILEFPLARIKKAKTILEW